MTTRRNRWALLAVTAAGAAAVAANRRRADGVSADRCRTERGVTVDRPVGAVRDFWSDPDRLGRALDRPVTVQQRDARGWRCVVRDRDDERTEWTAQVAVEDRGRVLRWRVEQGPVPHEGKLHLTPAPADRGTEIRVELRWSPVGGPVGRALHVLRRHDPDRELRTVLRRVKALVECGEVVVTAGDPSGRGPLGERVTTHLRDTLTTGGRA